MYKPRFILTVMNTSALKNTLHRLQSTYVLKIHRPGYVYVRSDAHHVCLWNNIMS